jgi:hypothetical protein
MRDSPGRRPPRVSPTDPAPRRRSADGHAHWETAIRWNLWLIHATRLSRLLLCAWSAECNALFDLCLNSERGLLLPSARLGFAVLSTRTSATVSELPPVVVHGHDDRAKFVDPGPAGMRQSRAGSETEPAFGSIFCRGLPGHAGSPAHELVPHRPHKERANGGQTKISSARIDLAAVLRVIERRGNHWGVDVLKCETGRRLVQPPLRELKEQPECIAIGTDCVRARLGLTDQALAEKALHQRRKLRSSSQCPPNQERQFRRFAGPGVQVTKGLRSHGALWLFVCCSAPRPASRVQGEELAVA